MMIAEMRQLKEQYLAWLRDEISMRQIDEWLEVTSPFLDRHNDYLQIYIKRADSGYLLTDDGYTINDLEMCGCHLDSPRRQSLLAFTLRGFGVKHNENTKELYVSAASENFALRKHSLIQAMLAVNDLYYLASPFMASSFAEAVETWLDSQGIRFCSGVKLSGATGYDHHYDFVIPKSSSHPERVLLSINNPDRASAERTVFAWEDTKEARSGDSVAYAILNDTQSVLSPAMLDALQNYEVRPVPWSERESVREELAA